MNTDLVGSFVLMVRIKNIREVRLYTTYYVVVTKHPTAKSHHNSWFVINER